MPLKIGQFVKSRSNTLGSGKVVGIVNDVIAVEYFSSINTRLNHHFHTEEIQRKIVQPQTRCYLFSNEAGVWRAGRIGQYDRDDNTYEVTFPNNIAGYFSESEIFVRCNLPIDDPTETLVLRAHETPFFHDRRLQLLKTILKQRALSHGISSLLSSNIQLYRHQIEVARRVLRDPVLRYLLADEVGLGKTIEAGIVIRQFLLDNPIPKVLILVPPGLVEQWSTELEEKFYVSDFKNRVEVYPLDDLDGLTEISEPSRFGLMVIDEAHHVAAGAKSDGSLSHKVFQRCRALSRAIPGLLLLSATPVLNNEADFLAMLHLLDPLTFNLSDLQTFRTKVAMRQQLGHILLSFKETSPDFVVKTTLTNLAGAFPNDSQLIRLSDNVRRVLACDPVNEGHKCAAIRAVRNHISDTYRLHRRMLRNRRDAVELPPRRNHTARTPDFVIEYEDNYEVNAINQLLEDWRTQAHRSIQILSHERSEDATKLNTALAAVFVTLLRTASTWPGVLRAVVQQRLGRDACDLSRDFSKNEIEGLRHTPLFSGEAEILNQILAVTQMPTEGLDRIQLCHQIVSRLLAKSKKIVIFSCFAVVAQRLAEEFSVSFPNGTIAVIECSQSTIENDGNLQRFRDDSECSVLICDSTAEEGLNIQFADWLIHFDLPYSPNRLEQRIGRLDRIGRSGGMRSRVILGSDEDGTFQDAWFQLLNEGLGIFDKSVAGLQFFIDEQTPKLVRRIFDLGADGLIHYIPEFKQELANEEVRISEQNVLDEIDVREAVSLDYFDKLKAFDENWVLIKRSYEAWIFEVLRFARRHPDRNPAITVYSWRDDTLLPKEVGIARFAAHLDTPLKYERPIAGQNTNNAEIVRIGQGLSDAIEENLNFDDRGQAFVLWRYVPSWESGEAYDWLGFRLNYVVEADISFIARKLQAEGLTGLSTPSLRRLGDSFFEPQVLTKFINLNFVELSDEKVLEIVRLPYDKERDTPKDFNLNSKRIAAIDNLVDASLWPQLCRRAKESSETMVRESERFKTHCKNLARLARRELDRQFDQINQRLERCVQLAEETAGLARDMELIRKLNKYLVHGVLHPKVRLDSIGFIVVSGRTPGFEDVD